MKKVIILFSLFTFILNVSEAQNCAFTSTTILSGWGQSAGCSGDFNNDGKTDFILNNQFSSNLIFTQTSGNSFNQTSSSFFSSSPYETLAADFNNDGNLDFLDINNSPLKIAIGQGNSTFTVQTSNQNGGYFPAVTKDFNLDGNADIVYCNYINGWLVTLLGQGNGNFNVPITLNTGGEHLNSRDFNNDFKLDVVFATGNSFHIATGVGNGSFNVPTSYTTPAFISALTTDDFNNDGKYDIATYSFSTNSIYIYFGNGLAFPIVKTITVSSFIRSLGSGDLNNDGKMDLVTMESLSSTQKNVNVFFNNNTHTLSVGVNYSLNMNGNLCHKPICGDFNNDGKSDLAVITYSGTSQSNILFSDVNCIWPGDANSDGIANNLDVLELGLHYGQTGPARSITSNAWTSYTCTVWTGTVTTGKNMHHADCNGDGTINQSDTLAIYNNYGFMHNKELSVTSATPQLNIIPDQALVVKNTWGTASIFLGDVTNPVNNINGIAFTTNFNNTLAQADSVYIEYIPSFINSNNLHFRKNSFTTGEIYTATTHTVNSNVSGYGKIAILHYKIKPNLVSDSVMNLGVIKATKMDAVGNTTTLSVGSGTFLAVTTPLGITEKNSNDVVFVYPNPSTGLITVFNSQSLKNLELKIFNTLGQEVFIKNIFSDRETILLNLSTGIYYYTISSNNSTLKKNKLIID